MSTLQRIQERHSVRVQSSVDSRETSLQEVQLCAKCPEMVLLVTDQPPAGEMAKCTRIFNNQNGVSHLHQQFTPVDQHRDQLVYSRIKPYITRDEDLGVFFHFKRTPSYGC